MARGAIQAPPERPRAHNGAARKRALAIAAVILAAVLVWRIATVSAPALHIRRTLSAYVRATGGSPTLAWPREGQAAVEVQGISAYAATAREKPVPIASVAKVMTAYVTLLEHPLAPGQAGFLTRVTHSESAEEERREELDESVLPVQAGELLSERQALEALLLPSANNIAALLAESEGGRAAFLARMNTTARELGMDSTTYTDPSGYEPSTVSTATDQLKLARAAMRIPQLAAIVAEPAVVLPVAGRVENYNALVGYDGYVGIKTGSDDAAGGCLMFAKRARVDGRALTVLGVVLGQHSGPLVTAALAAAQRLGDSAAAAVGWRTVLRAGTRVLSTQAEDGQHSSAVTKHELRALVWPGTKLHASVAIGHVPPQLATRSQLARVSVIGAEPSSTPALAARAVSGPSLGWRILHLL